SEGTFALSRARWVLSNCMTITCLIWPDGPRLHVDAAFAGELSARAATAAAATDTRILPCRIRAPSDLDVPGDTGANIGEAYQGRERCAFNEGLAKAVYSELEIVMVRMVRGASGANHPHAQGISCHHRSHVDPIALDHRARVAEREGARARAV